MSDLVERLHEACASTVYDVATISEAAARIVELEAEATVASARIEKVEHWLAYNLSDEEYKRIAKPLLDIMFPELAMTDGEVK